MAAGFSGAEPFRSTSPVPGRKRRAGNGPSPAGRRKVPASSTPPEGSRTSSSRAPGGSVASCCTRYGRGGSGKRSDRQAESPTPGTSAQRNSPPCSQRKTVAPPKDKRHSWATSSPQGARKATSPAASAESGTAIRAWGTRAVNSPPPNLQSFRPKIRYWETTSRSRSTQPLPRKAMVSRCFPGSEISTSHACCCSDHRAFTARVSVDVVFTSSYSRGVKSSIEKRLRVDQRTAPLGLAREPSETNQYQPSASRRRKSSVPMTPPSRAKVKEPCRRGSSAEGQPGWGSKADAKRTPIPTQVPLPTSHLREQVFL